MESLGILETKDNARNLYSVDGNEALEIKLVRNPEDLRSDACSFKPEMCHQVFGASEKVFGYKGLKIKLYYAAGNLMTYVGMEYDEKINTPGVEPDNVMEMLNTTIQSNFETNLTIFEKFLEVDDSFKPYGTLTHSFKLKDIGKDRIFEVYVNDTSNPCFLEYHRKVQTFVILYIDAANYVNPDEGNWMFFLVYEKYLSNNMTTKYAVVGYASVYQYYAYPSQIRPRISQVVILPPFRGRGLCSHLLNAIYSYYVSDRNVLDITVESPSSDFQRVRDFVDCRNCMQLDAFSPSKIKFGFSSAIVGQAREKYKINKKQAKRIYEILRLKNTSVHNEDEYGKYVKEVKNRLRRPMQSACFQKKLSKRKFWGIFSSDPEELYVSSSPEEQPSSEIESQIEEAFADLLEQYNMVINRLNVLPKE